MKHKMYMMHKGVWIECTPYPHELVLTRYAYKLVAEEAHSKATLFNQKIVAILVHKDLDRMIIYYR